jgi:predicted RND superfamily exporter protein
MKEKMLRNWARFASIHPWWVIGALLLVVVVSLILSSRIRLDMNWSDLLPMGDPMAQEFEKIIKEYKSASTSIIVVRGKESDIKQFADRIVPEIEKLEQYFERVDYKLDTEFLSQHAFMLVKSGDLKRTADMFENLNLIPLLKNINDNFETEYIQDEEFIETQEKESEAVRTLDGFHYWLKAMDSFVSDPEVSTQVKADSAVERFLFGDPYFISQDKRILLLTMKPTFSSLDIEKDVASTDSLHKILERTLPDFPNVQAGITGTIPLQRDEMKYNEIHMRTSTILALVLVISLFILTFRMWSTPVLAAVNLVIAIIITSGVVSIYPGRLNLMTMMFAVILIGLGIDFSIHIISIYSERRKVDKDAASAMEQTLLRSGSGIITGGLTTAAAFFTLTISVTRGIKEMGFVLGIGMICAMVMTIIALPAWLVARERFISRLKNRDAKPINIEFKALERFGRSVKRRPLLYLIIGVVLTGFFFFQTTRIRFDYNMLNIEPKGLASVQLQDTIVKAFDMSVDFAMITTPTIEESWEIAEKAKKMPIFGRVEHIGDYVPPVELQRNRQPYVRKIRRTLEKNKKREKITERHIDKLKEQLERLDMNIYEFAQMAFLGGKDKIDKKCQSIIGDPEAENPHNIILSLIDKIEKNPEQAVRQMNLFQKYYLPTLRSKIYSMSNPEIVELETVPAHIKERYVNEEGNKFLVTIFGKKQMWNYEYMKLFTKQLKRVDPRITGAPPMFLSLIRYIGRDGLRATILTVFIVLILLWLDFRSFGMALLGIIPLLAGGIWMIGLLKTFGLMLTFINVMGIPMIVGIGIDDGVHLLHRYRFEGLDRTPLVLKSTGKAILLTSLTTMAGFGAMMAGPYRGFISLGALLATGVGACFVTTVLILPAIISLWQRRGK